MIRADIQTKILDKFLSSSDEKLNCQKAKQELDNYIIKLLDSGITDNLKEILEMSPNTIDTISCVDISRVYGRDVVEKYKLDIGYPDEIVTLPKNYPNIANEVLSEESTLIKLSEMCENLRNANKKYFNLREEIKTLLGESYLNSETLKKRIPQLFE